MLETEAAGWLAPDPRFPTLLLLLYSCTNGTVRDRAPSHSLRADERTSVTHLNMSTAAFSRPGAQARGVDKIRRGRPNQGKIRSGLQVAFKCWHVGNDMPTERAAHLPVRDVGVVRQAMNFDVATPR